MTLWGILPIALDIVLNVMDVYTITGARFVIAFVLLALYLGSRNRLPQRKQLLETSWKLLAIATVFLGLNYGFFLSGLKLTSPTNVEVIMQLAPVIFGLSALAIFNERYSRVQWAGLGVFTLGMALFFHEQLQIFWAAAGTLMLGNLVIACAAISWAIYALAQKQLLNTLSSMSVMLLIYGGCSLLYLPMWDWSVFTVLTWQQWGVLFFCGVNTLIAYCAFSESLEHLEASRASAVVSLTPLVTIAAMEILNLWMPEWITPEHLTPLSILGALLVVGGSVAIAIGNRKKAIA
jgi:drug/metabolite transporter (DMT)-like permease